MHTKKPKSIIRRFIIGLILIAATLLVIGFLKMQLTTKAVETNRWVDHTHAMIAETKTLTRIFQDIRINERGYLLSGERAYLESIGVSKYSFDQHLIKLSILTRDNPEQQVLLDQVRATFNELIEQAVQPLLQYRQDYQQNLELLLEHKHVPLLMSISDSISKNLQNILITIEENEYELLDQRQREVEYWYKIDQIVTYTGPVLIIIITFLAGIGAIIRLDRYQKQQKENEAALRQARDRFASVIKGSNLGTWEWNIAQDTTIINETWAQLLGYTAKELEPCSRRTFEELSHPEDYKRSQRLLEEHFTHANEYYTCDIRMRHKDGHWVWIVDRGQVILWDEQGNPILMTGTHADISKRVADAQTLQRSEEENRRLFEAMNQGFAYCKILLDEQGLPNDFRILRVNKSFELQTGLLPEESVGKQIKELLPNLEPYWVEENGKVALSGVSCTFEVSSSDLNRLFKISSFSPEFGYFAMIIDDITQQKKLEQQLYHEKTLFETTLLSVGDGVISTDAQGRVQVMNKVSEYLTGWQGDEAKGLPFEEVFKILCGSNRLPCPSPVDEVLKTGAAYELAEDTILIARDGVERFINDSAAPILNVENEITGVVLVFRDSTEQRKKQNEILTLSVTDALTTLPNRRYYDQAKHTMDGEPYYPLTLVLADVNGLKLTNDAFGHDAGDSLLCKVGEVMRTTCREEDIICRIGGDEFVLLLPQTDALHAKAIVDRINKALKKEEIRGIHLSVSFGYAVKEEQTDSFDDTFKLAEDVMYRNKLTDSMTFKKQVITTLLERLFEQQKGTRQHSQLVSQLAGDFSKELGYPEDEVEELRQAGLFHDIGKIAIRPEILAKPKQDLNRIELMELRRHVEIGYNILRSVGEYASFADAVLHHHERWDGSGYPQNQKQDAISEQAQILAITNAYADLTTGEEAMDKEKAIAYLMERSNSMFNPSLVSRFATMILSA